MKKKSARPIWFRRILSFAPMASVVGLQIAVSLLGVLDGKETQYIRLIQAGLYTAAIWAMYFALVQRVWVALAIAVPVALLFPLELWMRLQFGVPVSAQTVALWQETTVSEVANFMLAYGTTLALCYAIWGVLYGGSIWIAYRQAVIWRNKGSFLCLLVFPVIIGVQYVLGGAQPWLTEEKTQDPFDGNAVQGWSREWEDVFPVNVLVGFQQYAVEMNKLQATQQALEQQALNGNLADPGRAPDVVVLIVGESSSAVRWGLMGYGRQTTPLLAVESNLVAFTDVVSLSNSTRTAVPGVLSRRPVLRPEGVVDLQAEPSLIKAFREAGYQTHWYSNQAPFGKFDAPIAVHAREAEDVRFYNPGTFRSKASLDEVLLTPLKAAMTTPGRHLFVLHTLGSHFEYELRYPEGFDQFQPSLKSAGAGGALIEQGKRDERVSNSYDNSVLYTDYVISQVIKLAQARQGKNIVVYFSDHGVDLPQEACPYRGETRRSETAYRVPVLFWLSDSMRQARQDYWQTLVNNRNQAYTTRAMNTTLLDLASIQVSGQQSQESFLRESLKGKEPRLVAVGDALVNFDQAKAHNACWIQSSASITTEK